MNTSKNIIINSFIWRFMERAFAQGMGFLVQIILARILMPQDFASLAIIVAVTNYALILVQSGLSTAIIQKEDVDDLDISTLMVSSLAVALILYVFIFFAAPYIADYYGLTVLKYALRVLGVILFLNAINAIQLAILQRTMQFKKLFFRSMIAVPIAGVVGITMAYMGYGVWALVAHNVVNIFVLVICLISEFHFDFHFSWKRAKKLYTFSGKIMLASLVSGLYDTIRTMTIGRKYTSDELAFYDKAYTYSLYAVTTVGYSISSVILPVLSRQQTNVLSLKNTSRKAIQLSTFFMFPLLLGIVAIAKPLVSVVLTDKWIDCVPFLMLFCILRLPECMITIDKQAYYALGKSGICLRYEIGLCIFNLLALIFTLRYGIFYIAVGAVIVQLVAGVTIFCISSATYGYKLKERITDIAKPLFNSSIMAIIVWFIQKNCFESLWMLIVQVLVGIVIYILLAFFTKDTNLIIVSKLLFGFIPQQKDN